MEPRKRALIVGATGQDGSYLAELLLSKGYEVHGIKRRSSSLNTQRVDHLYADPHDQSQFRLHYGDLTDGGVLIRLLAEIQPHEVYNLGAQSHVRVSFDEPEYTADTIAMGTLRLLEALRAVSGGWPHRVRFYQASSSEMFGASPAPQSEKTPFQPRSPYAVAKVFAHQMTVNYREAYGLHACCGILFNHESPRRGETFVTRKIARGVARIAYGHPEPIYLGNLDAKRDWGHARDYVEGMWRILKHPAPADFVLATGESHSVREFVEAAFAQIDSKIVWEGRDHGEIGRDAKTGVVRVRIDHRYFRPTEVNELRGDASAAVLMLGWEPKIRFHDLVREMVGAELAAMQESTSWEAAR